MCLPVSIAAELELTSWPSLAPSVPALVLITSKPGSKVARHLDALTGAVLWEVALPFSTEEELAHLPADVLFATEAGEAVLYVLAGGGETITRLRLSDGARLEVWTNEDSNLYVALGSRADRAGSCS